MKELEKEALKLKKEQVAQLEDKIKRAAGIVIIDYRGITVEEDTNLRSALRAANVEYKVIKNRLILRAFKNSGYDGLDKVFEGPTAVAFSYDDATAPARIISENIKKLNKLSMKGGVVENQVMDAAGINKIASIPSKSVLLGQLLGLLTSPVRSLAVALNEVAKKQA
ncbi:MAG: 50S ribosomal protein L10 [Clostridiales bacterium]|nr:50S ribosomal protein L10 [Clostridiales bacterium]